MFQVDLDADGQSEYVLLGLVDSGIVNSQFYYLTDERWTVGIINNPGFGIFGEKIHDMITNGDIVIVEPRFKHLRIGDLQLQPASSDQQK